MRFSPFIALLVALATPATCLPEYNSSPVLPTSAPALKTNTDSEQQHIKQTAVKELQSRGHGYFDVRDCRITPRANEKRILEGMKYLRTVPKDKPTYQEGCGRVSCSYMAAIWLCGNIQSRTRQTLPSWDLVAQAAGSVHHTCYKEDNSKDYIWGISGEAYPRGSYGKDWYVKVGKDEQIHC
ncbi:hypothetical protein PG996_008170 [Apiospora saccharicola]|uniref:Ecp2 effector protein domain-containing protein n=1 Tax=Apiospora saccharicola TaxID=335842 RepID=A0ABR1UX55_9PEZI